MSVVRGFQRWIVSGVACFFFQAEDGIRDAQESRGLGDVYKRQVVEFAAREGRFSLFPKGGGAKEWTFFVAAAITMMLSLIHI